MYKLKKENKLNIFIKIINKNNYFEYNYWILLFSELLQMFIYYYLDLILFVVKIQLEYVLNK